MEVTAQGHRLAKGRRPGHRPVGHSPSPTPHHHHPSSGLLTRAPFPPYTRPGFHQQSQTFTGHTKGKNDGSERQNKRENQTHGWQGMSEFSGQESKTTVINMLRVLMNKVDNMREQMGNVNKDMESLEGIF